MAALAARCRGDGVGFAGRVARDGISSGMHARRAISNFLIVVAFVVLLPVIIPAALVIAAVNKHRRRKVAQAFVCVRCREVLGPKSLEPADDEWRKDMKELRRKYPHLKIRVVRTCHAICPTCGTRYTFRDKERTFVRDRMR
jgi:hypothetical protein